MTALRLFIGIPCVPEEPVRSLLTELTSDVREGMKVVPAENLHITLKFLGATSPENLEQTIDMLHREASVPAFRLRLARVGCFSSALWLGVEPHSKLEALAKRFRGAAAALGYQPEEKPYVPHVTVARLSGSTKFDRKEWEERYSNQYWQDVDVARLVLYQSDTGAESGIYKELASVALA